MEAKQTKSPQKVGVSGLDRILQSSGEEALRAASGTADVEKLARATEAAKAAAEARQAILGLTAFARWTSWIAASATSLTIILALWTLHSQNKQHIASEDRERAKEEDTQWREAMKSVSFDDSSKAMSGAMWMESFFDSPSPLYQRLSRHVAASLLPLVNNVGGFDIVLTDLRKHTNQDNQTDIIDIAQKLSNCQWKRYGRPSDPTDLPFVQKNVQGVALVQEGGAKCDNKGDGNDYNFAAWEIDSASQALRKIWEKASPSHQLGGLILENTNHGESFGADFTNASLKNGVLANASFRGATLTGTNLTNVIIIGNVDLSDISRFEGSDWTDTRWWRAKAISQALCTYLESKFAAPRGSPLPAGCA